MRFRLVLSFMCLLARLSSRAAANDEITLRFLKLDTNPAWKEAAATFAEQDASVGQVVLYDVGDGAEDFDCSMAEQFHEARWQYADLTALIQADPNFNLADLFPGAWESVTVDGVTLGYPLAIAPDVVRVDVDWFNRLGVPVPDNNWTISDFIQTLHLLKPDANTPAPFGVRMLPLSTDFITHLAMANSTMPIDIRTQPPTINLNQPQTLAAMQQALDLARGGFIAYPQENLYAGEPIHFNAGDYAMWSDIANGGLWSPTMSERNLRMLAYPRGAAAAPISYWVTSGYVRQGSPHADACYRWFSYLATRPDVVGIPAHMSQAPQYAALSGQGEAFLAFYETIRQRASDPASRVPQYVYPSSFLSNINARMDRAYREYIFEGLPLESVLLSVQRDTETYFACTSAIPSVDELHQMSLAEMMRYDSITKECRRAYVPEVMWMFGG